MTKHKSQDERRNQILAAAKECFIRNGYAHTRVDDIARESGLSKGGIYFHFKSKRDIFDALLENQQQATATLVREIEASDAPVVDKLTQLGTMMLRNFAEGEDHAKFLIVLAEMGIREADVYQKVVGAHEAYVETLARYIRAGIASGEIRDMDPRMAALFMKFLLDGLEQGLALGYNFDVLEFAATGFDVLFHGLKPGKS